MLFARVRFTRSIIISSVNDRLFLAALQRDRQRVPHSGGAAVRRQPRRPRDLLDALRDQLRDALQDLRDRAGRARLHHGAHEEVQQHHT